MNINRKFVLPVVILIVLGFFFIFKNSKEEILNFPSKNSEIVAFGDSLIEGIGSENGGDFISLLSKKTNTPIQNFGKSGDTTKDALGRLSEVLEKVPNPKIVIILLGGNDYLKRIPREQTFRNLGQIVGAFQSRGAIVLLLGVRGGLLKDNYDDYFEKLSKDYKTAYVPNVLDGLIGNQKYMYDSVHPNNLGYTIIANKVYEEFKKLL